jgi:hypothetical protein
MAAGKRLLTTEAVRKRRICMITPRQHARKRLGLRVRRGAQLRGLIDFVDVVSKAALRMPLAARSARFIAQE